MAMLLDAIAQFWLSLGATMINPSLRDYHNGPGRDGYKRRGGYKQDGGGFKSNGFQVASSRFSSAVAPILPTTDMADHGDRTRLRKVAEQFTRPVCISN